LEKLLLVVLIYEKKNECNFGWKQIEKYNK